jgi:hypothetical protein
MLIPNPWPNYPMTRTISKTPQGDFVIVASTRGDLEVPDDTVEALIEPVANGRPGAPAIAQGRIWSREWGCLEIKDHIKKQELAKEVAECEARQKAARKARPKAETVKPVEEAEKPVKKVEKPVKKVENPTK